MRLVFMGTPDFAVPTLEALLAAGHDVAAVYTRAPAAAGRGMPLRPSPVGALAAERGIPVRSPASLRAEGETDALRALRPALAVVVAYGLLLPRAILDVPPLGCLNLHGSLLPRWRGAAPMQRALMAGDPETGVMVMRMEAGLDIGPVALTRRTVISDDMTAGDLHDVLSAEGAALMAEAVDRSARGDLAFVPQEPDGVTYARKIDKAECRIDWGRPAREVHDHVRGLSPAPGAFFEADFGRGPERIKVLRSRVLAPGVALDGGPGTVEGSPGRLVVACGEGAVELLTVQRAGKPPMPTVGFLNGTRIAPGFVLPR